MHVPALWRKLWVASLDHTRISSHGDTLPRWRPLSRQELRRLPSDVSGWWLVAAEVLAVVVLLILAAVAGDTAQKLSAAIDNQALADLATSEPLEVCVNGATSLRGLQSQGEFFLESQFTWPNGTVASCVKDLTQYIPSNSMFTGHGNSSLLDDLTLSAMYHCGLVRGHARHSQFVRAMSSAELAQLSHNDEDPIRRLLHVQTRNVTVSGGPLQVPWVVSKEGDSLLEELTGIDRLLSPLPSNAVVVDDKTRAWNASLRVTRFFPELSESDMGVLVVRLEYPTKHPPWLIDDGYADPVAWLWLNLPEPALIGAAECMAHRSQVDVQQHLDHYMCVADGVSFRTPRALNLSLSRLRVVPGTTMMLEPYKCAGGTDATSRKWTDMQSTLSMYKLTRKAELTTTLFFSMINQSYDDVYAVYTGILGALFGAFALLVTTLFVYLVAALKRSFVR